MLPKLASMSQKQKSVKKHTSSKIPKKKFWGSQMTRGSKKNRQSQ
jgi:hypothetical protein